MINILIIDDERKACTNLKHMLTEYIDPGISIIGMAHNTAEAEKQINKYAPDAVFLDIEMPNENAFQFLDRISPLNFEVVFVTSYDEYAIKAFKLNAVDYILKPISINELQSATLRLKEKINVKKMIAANSGAYTEIAQQINSKTKPQKITLKDTHTTEVLDFNDIYFIEAQSSYSKITFLKDNKVKEMTVSNPLSDYEEVLPPSRFYRIHRSYLVNCAHIKSILNDGSNKVIIKNDVELPVSRRRYAPLLEFLKDNDRKSV